MKATRIKKIVLELDGKEISLGLDEAKQLQSALNEMFERQQTVIHCSCHSCRPWHVFWSSPNTTGPTIRYLTTGSTTGIGAGMPLPIGSTPTWKLTSTGGSWQVDSKSTDGTE